MAFVVKAFARPCSALFGNASKILALSSSLPNYNFFSKRDNMTLNEKLWFKKKSAEILEKAKNEKGPDLNIDLKQPQLFFDKVEELKDADETVKRLLSLEYANRRDYKRYEEELIKDMVRKLPIEEDTLEIQIALHTLNIKRMCQNQIEFSRRNKRVEFFLFRAIHRRDRLLAELYYKDNSRFEWLIEKLNLQGYKLKEKYEYTRETRYQKYVKEVKIAAKAMRQKKLDELKQEFDKQKKIFFKERNDVLEKIKKDLADLGFKDIKLPEIPPLAAQK